MSEDNSSCPLTEESQCTDGALVPGVGVSVVVESKHRFDDTSQMEGDHRVDSTLSELENRVEDASLIKESLRRVENDLLIEESEHYSQTEESLQRVNTASLTESSVDCALPSEESIHRVETCASSDSEHRVEAVAVSADVAHSIEKASSSVEESTQRIGDVICIDVTPTDEDYTDDNFSIEANYGDECSCAVSEVSSVQNIAQLDECSSVPGDQLDECSSVPGDVELDTDQSTSGDEDMMNSCLPDKLLAGEADRMVAEQSVDDICNVVDVASQPCTAAAAGTVMLDAVDNTCSSSDCVPDNVNCDVDGCTIDSNSAAAVNCENRPTSNDSVDDNSPIICGVIPINNKQSEDSHDVGVIHTENGPIADGEISTKVSSTSVGSFQVEDGSPGDGGGRKEDSSVCDAVTDDCTTTMDCECNAGVLATVDSSCPPTSCCTEIVNNTNTVHCVVSAAAAADSVGIDTSTSLSVASSQPSSCNISTISSASELSATSIITPAPADSCAAAAAVCKRPSSVDNKQTAVDTVQRLDTKPNPHNSNTARLSPGMARRLVQQQQQQQQPPATAVTSLTVEQKQKKEKIAKMDALYRQQIEAVMHNLSPSDHSPTTKPNNNGHPIPSSIQDKSSAASQDSQLWHLQGTVLAAPVTQPVTAPLDDTMSSGLHRVMPLLEDGLSSGGSSDVEDDQVCTAGMSVMTETCDQQPTERELSVKRAISEIRSAIEKSKSVSLTVPSSEALETCESQQQQQEPVWITRKQLRSGGQSTGSDTSHGHATDSQQRSAEQPADINASIHTMKEHDIHETAGDSESDTSVHGHTTAAAAAAAADYETDEETDELLNKPYSDKAVDIVELTGSPVSRTQIEKRCSRAREVTLRDPDNNTVLIEGVLFRASYLGSTQLISEGQPSKSLRMMQAQEAVGRIKAPVGEHQPSTEVDLFISVEKIMILNTDLQEIMMDHALRTISYIADIGDLLVLMARRGPVTPGDNCDDTQSRRRHQTKICCHVFETDEAQLIAQSIGQAFQVAYIEFLKANGIDTGSDQLQDVDYQDVLNQQEICGEELLLFANRDMQKEIIITKLRGEALGVVIVESGWGSMVPTVVLANMSPTGAASRCSQLNIGDQIMSLNGVSFVGLPLSTCQNYIKATRSQTVVKLVIVSCAPVVEVTIKRPDIKYQLGFSVQNGVICSLLRGGIAERGGVRVGHRIIDINGSSVVAVTHERIVKMLATAVGEIHMKTMPMSIYRLLTGQDVPHYI